MAVTMFRMWSQAEIEQAIVALEQAIAGGVASVNYVGGGTVQYVPQAMMERTLARLYTALEDRAGTAQTKRPHRIVYTRAGGF